MSRDSADAHHFPFSGALLCILFALSSTAICISVQSAQPVTVSVVPSSITAGVGRNFTIEVTITDVSDLYGWEFRLNWNPSLLDVVDVVQGAFLKSGGDTFFTYNVNATEGHVTVDCSLLGETHGVSGSGTLANVTFHVKDSGDCPLDLYSVSLLNSLEQSIPCQTVDGYGYFNPPRDVAVTGVSVSSVIVVPEGIVNVGVDVQNQGDYDETFNVTVYANSQTVATDLVFLSSGSSTTVPFQWDTTGFGKGEYLISANASILPDEVDVADNYKTADSVLTILYPGHDIAAIGVEPLKTIVGQGYNMFIVVTVKNYGTSSETFDTALSANTTVVQIQPVTLASGDRAKLNFTWNTNAFSRRNYSMSAYAAPVSGETETYDNNSTATKIVMVSIPGDVNGDRTVELMDFFVVSSAYNSSPGKPNWDSNADTNNDGMVELMDFFVISQNYGEVG
jgi:hypothetical protein